MTRFLAAAIVACGLFGSSAAMARPADPTPSDESGTSSTPTFQQTLEKGLKARRPEEFAFIRTVVHKVDHGELPRDLVESTFLWARSKGGLSFEYFRKGLTVRAQKIGITL
jgi:hypothetical protein